MYMKTIDYYKSLATELESLKNRVRNFIRGSHWQTDGEWKESVLRSILNRNMPETVRIGRGFIVTQNYSSTQIDILIYRHDTPVFFRDGDLVFIPPEGVLGVIEVKTKLNTTGLKHALSKLILMRSNIESSINKGLLFGLFVYEAGTISNQKALRVLNKLCTTEKAIIDLICLGNSQFVKWWAHNPNHNGGAYKKWHSYKLPKLAPGYFIHNVLMHMSTERYWVNQDMWFPSESKEFRKDGEIELELLTSKSNGRKKPRRLTPSSGNRRLLGSARR
jgi:hypothetical protein